MEAKKASETIPNYPSTSYEHYLYPHPHQCHVGYISVGRVYFSIPLSGLAWTNGVLAEVILCQSQAEALK